MNNKLNILKNIRDELLIEGNSAITQSFNKVLESENEKINFITDGKITNFDELEKEYMSQKVKKGLFPFRFIQNMKNRAKINFFDVGDHVLSGIFWFMVITTISFFSTIIGLDLFNTFIGLHVFLFLTSFMISLNFLKNKETKLTKKYLEYKQQIDSINKNKEKGFLLFKELISSTNKIEKNIAFNTRDDGWSSCLLKNKCVSKKILSSISKLLSEKEFSNFLEENNNNITIESALIKYIELNNKFTAEKIAKSYQNENVRIYEQENILV